MGPLLYHFKNRVPIEEIRNNIIFGIASLSILVTLLTSALSIKYPACKSKLFLSTSLTLIHTQKWLHISYLMVEDDISSIDITYRSYHFFVYHKLCGWKFVLFGILSVTFKQFFLVGEYSFIYFLSVVLLLRVRTNKLTYITKSQILKFSHAKSIPL